VRIQTKLFLAFTCIALSSYAAPAGVIYSNISPSYPGGTLSDAVTSDTYFGTIFTTAAAGTLASVEIDLYGFYSPVTVGLYTNSAGQPGTLLESWSAVIPVHYPSPPATVLTSVVNPSLSAATAYWLVLTQASASQNIVWYGNDEGIDGGVWIGNSLASLSQIFVSNPAPGIRLNSLPPSVFISDSQNNRIRGINTGSGAITTVAGNGTGWFGGDGGAAVSAELHSPFGVAVDSSGNPYLADTTNNRVRKVGASGTISTLAGNGAPSYSGDNGAAIFAGLNSPTGVAVDNTGNLYIADKINNRIRRVGTSGNITTVAGNGTVGYAGDGGLATSAELYYPTGVAVDSAGNLYIADYDNNRIRKVNTSGIITTVAGNGLAGYNCGNGVATSVGLHNPYGVAVDGGGNLYIADYGNQCIRKVNGAGNIATVAGNGIASYGGDGGPATSAELNYPTGVAVDSAGNLYIADYVNNRVRKVDSFGTITTFAGNGKAGFSGDGGPATGAELYNPTSVAVSPSVLLSVTK
jgi:sugar lactone lactonase YvrE